MFRKSRVVFLMGVAAAFPAWAQEEGAKTPEAAAVKPPEEALPRPLRRFDTNKDGKLTGEELMLARQAHNRGGRPAEPTADQWRETLGRFKNQWMRRNMDVLDLNGDGTLDEAERERMERAWREIAEGITAVRVEITKKYDENDDGELNNEERQKSRRESDRRRREVEDAVTAKLAAEIAKPEAQKEDAAATGGEPPKE